MKKSFPLNESLQLQTENEGGTIDNYTNVIITRLKEERRRLLENPNYKFAPSTNKLRQRNFKSRYNRKKNLRLVQATPIDAIPLQVIYPTNKSDYEEMDGDYESEKDSTE